MNPSGNARPTQSGLNKGKAPVQRHIQTLQHAPSGNQLQTKDVKARLGATTTKAFETSAYSAGLTAAAAAEYATRFPRMWQPVIRALAQFENDIEYGLGVDLGSKPGQVNVTMKAALAGANTFIIASDGVQRLQCEVGFTGNPALPKAIGCVETRISAQQEVGYKARKPDYVHSHELALSASRAENQADIHFVEMAGHITHISGNRYAVSTIYTDPIFAGEHAYQGKSGLIFLEGDRVEIKEHIRLGGLLTPNLLSTLGRVLQHIHNDGFAHGSLLDNIVVVLENNGNLSLFIRASPCAKKMGAPDFPKTVQADLAHLRSLMYHAAGIQHDYATKQPKPATLAEHQGHRSKFEQVNLYTSLVWNDIYQELWRHHQAGRTSYTAVTALAKEVAAKATVEVELATAAEAAAQASIHERRSSLVLLNPTRSQAAIPEWFQYLLEHDPETLRKLFDGAGLDRRSLVAAGPSGNRMSQASSHSSEELPIQKHSPAAGSSDEEPFLPLMGNSANP